MSNDFLVFFLEHVYGQCRDQLYYIIYFKFLGGTPDQWWFGISPEGIGTLGMLVNFSIAIVVSKLTDDPPDEIQELVESVRIPKGATQATDVH